MPELAAPIKPHNAPLVSGLIDRFSVFLDTVSLQGWCFSPGAPIAAFEIRPSGFPHTHAGRRFTPNWLVSPDVGGVFGTAAAQCRFSVTITVGPHAAAVCGGHLVAILADGAVVLFAPLGVYQPSLATQLFEQFFNLLGQLPAPTVLEIGSRTHDGFTQRGRLPADAHYTGCDIKAGDNVDVVCDAHDLATALPHTHFQAVFAISVLEHLLMPWKFVLELNKVLALGALGLFTTHQCWPLHETPWDYWRYSDQAWTGLLNAATGFEIIGAAMGEPAYIVAEHCHMATNFAPTPAGFLASNVLFRKTAETRLSWDVAVPSLTATLYPG